MSALDGVPSFRSVLASGLRALAARLERVMTAPPSPNPGELNALVDHVAYEIAALEASAALVQQTSAWVFLETFLLHARLLREVLWGQRSKGRYGVDDVRAEHFCARWPGMRGACPPTLAATKDAIDKQLAHITRQRVDPNVVLDLRTKVTLLHREIRAGWAAFLRCLAGDARAATFRSAVTQKCADLSVATPS